MKAVQLPKRAAGVFAHVTSLPGPHGIGDFGPAAYSFVDWLQSAGQSLWQWLPTTPIGPGDSPYQSVSAFAGSPLMVALEPMIESGWLAAPKALPPEFAERNTNFAIAVPWRIAQLRLAAAGFAAKAGAAEHAAFAAFCQREASWLDDYALFMALESAQQGAPWWQWPAAVRDREPAALKAAREEHANEVRFWQFVQWCFDSQLAALKRYANARGIGLVGDVPIFIAHHSADCWARPDLYELDANYQPSIVAGCPPDAFTEDGQRWGNPLYRWDRMAAEGYAWWIDRVRRLMAIADVFRIDHFRGFAGYYAIPASEPTARVGTWLPGPGTALFDAIAAALGELPIIAEDLGLITPDVVTLIAKCGFPGMKVVQFGFGGDADNEHLPHNLNTNCAAYSSTHDSDTVRGWWERWAGPTEKRYAGAYLVAGDHDIHWGAIRACANSVARYAVFPLQDVLGLGSAHRMNIPGTLGGDNWRWRFEPSMLTPEATRVLKLITAASGRAPIAVMWDALQ